MAEPVELEMERVGALRCDCWRCAKEREDDPLQRKMHLCPICGNKRCPHASDHRLACTGSNEPGQDGSIYG